MDTRGVMRFASIGPLLLAVAVAVAVAIAVAGCSFDTLGGREKCWAEEDSWVASLWRGTLQIDAFGAQLQAPEGNLVLLPGALATRIGEGGSGELVRGSDVVARAGDEVTLWGGIGGDGTMVVCAVEEIHSP
jgi:hypothetical protein